MPDFLDPSTIFGDSPRPPNGDYAGNVTADGGRAGGTQIRVSGRAWYDDTTGASLDGPTLPNPRLVSNTVFRQTDADGDHIDMPNPGGFSSLLWVWGQFIDHDLTQTATDPAAGRANIVLPADDPMRDAGITELNFVRSGFLAGTGGGSTPRQMPNQITSFLDASMVYGSGQGKLDALRVPGSAELRLSAEGNILFNQNDPFFANNFIAGDTRANENLGLLAMHALFAREHHRIVDALAAADPTLTVAELFEGARARVEALVQAITYNEFLPKLIGTGALPAHTGFNPAINPAVSLEFSTAIYRLGHTLLSPAIHRIDENGATDARGHIALMDAFQTRGVLEQTGVGDIFRGMATTRSQELDTFIVEDVRSFLFNAGGAFGNDLAALNIQRGRDHGLPSYNEMRGAFGLAARTSFSQVTSDAAVAARLQSAYGSVDRLDLWVGGLAEDPVAGGMVGEVFRTVLIDQFSRLRAGDPQFSLHRGFSAAELQSLWSTRLSDVIVRNTDVDAMQLDALRAFARIGGGAGNDTVNAAAGSSLLVGFAGNDVLNGRAANDHLDGGAGADRLVGNAGNDGLVGGAGTDTVLGGAGNDTIRISDVAAQLDSMDGGPGFDTIAVISAGSVVVLGGTGRIQSIERFAAGGHAIHGTSAGDNLDFSRFAEATGIVRINGLAGNDTVVGRNGADTLLGGTGADSIRGGAGNDSVTGGAGNDTIEGGTGNDLLDGGGGADRLSGLGGADVFRFVASTAAGNDTIVGFDLEGNDVVSLVGYSALAGLSTAARLQAVQAATSFAAGGATIALDELGDSGQIFLEGVTTARLGFTPEDFTFG
jgi:peroxidase